ncbi:transmembrane protein [Thalictrum thalictroides]|uniref:Transmembrane protein n=1 Tax=Thalictrum thalictroides TaxID=46969 RepID=A0A7J6VMT7_THATH|nr:transmembrane protein [Thalictrum thalictroides]
MSKLMASFTSLNNVFISNHLPISKKVQINSTSFFSSSHNSSKLSYNRESLFSSTKKTLQLHRPSRSLTVLASQSDFLRVIQTAWKVGKDGIEAGTELVPVSIPRPIARIGVAGVVLSISLFVLKSFLSTAFFILGVMGLSYFIFLALNKDEGPKGDGGGSNTSEETTLEEARRIMEKYK